MYNLTTNQYSTVAGQQPPYYGANGNLINDGFHHYTWDADGNMALIDGGTSTWTFDALGRWAERTDASGLPYIQAVYDPGGTFLAQTTATYLRSGRVPLSGGAMAQYTYSGLSVYVHPNWLGSSRLESTPWPVGTQPTLVSELVERRRRGHSDSPAG
jgi:hypothetical protein